MAGRPTNWSEEILEQSWQYIEGGWQEQGDAWPSVVGLVKYIGRASSTIYLWAKNKDTGFSEILARCNEEQQRIAFNGGAKNEYNATIVKLLLGKHGYHDKQDNTHAGADGGPVQIQEIRRTIVDAEHTDS